ncbi:16S rRNA G966 N2-methylase RsmD [Evansella vedderi]|uniref:16S rRNA G966 N2-methylase RsmD n=1 Tax=Evansella vedderi TaxID=38282 RepID=A0ABT9ZVU8_9BACI|nr:ParB N-terminal domain-containing protein [Evansella vedderi]MDQ0255358.1 16S rRNA G966 N2-methylase RsmD [Evansella vedderi]
MKERLIDPKELFFGQQHIGTAELFGEHYHTVPLTETPHYQFLLGNDVLYLDYLQASWGYLKPRKNRIEEKKRKLKKFETLLSDILHDGCQSPIKVCKRMDGKYVVIHGNHRASICLYLGREIKAKEISMERHLKKITKQPSRYSGVNDDGKTYQKLLQIITGNLDKNDSSTNLPYIKSEDLKGKTVLDVGCGYGMYSFYAAMEGATKVMGLDVSNQLLTAAIRANTLFAKPCYFKNVDFSQPCQLEKADTTFVFAGEEYFNHKILADNLINHTKKVVYFETTHNSEVPKELKEIFSTIQLMGSTEAGNRKIYRCEM